MILGNTCYKGKKSFQRIRIVQAEIWQTQIIQNRNTIVSKSKKGK